jgi:hypothetical protein
LDGAASDNCWKLSENDLVCLAGQFGLCVTKPWFGIYKVTFDAVGGPPLVKPSFLMENPSACRDALAHF